MFKCTIWWRESLSSSENARIFRELPYFGFRNRIVPRLLWTWFNISHTQYTWNNMHHYYPHLMQSFLRGTGYVEQLELDLSALHHQLVDDALSYSIWNNGPWYTSNCAWMANCGAESLLRRLVVDKTSYIIYRVLNGIRRDGAVSFNSRWEQISLFFLRIIRTGILIISFRCRYLKFIFEEEKVREKILYKLEIRISFLTSSIIKLSNLTLREEKLWIKVDFISISSLPWILGLATVTWYNNRNKMDNGTGK